MAYFNLAVIKHKAREGRYSNHPKDPGAESYKGISRRYNKYSTLWQIIDKAKSERDFPACLELDQELQKRVDAHYRSNYWNKMRLDEIRDQDIAEEIFDAGAGPNGIGIAVRIAQGAVILLGRDIGFDGQIGPQTITALNNYPHKQDLLKLMNCLQFVAFLFGSRGLDTVVAAVRQRKELLREFLRGWLKRIDT